MEAGQLRSTITALHERAVDLERTIASAEEGGRLHNWPAALCHFQLLSQQLQLLSDRVIAEEALLQDQAVQPLSLTEHSATIPMLLSTMRDPEQEEELQRELAAAAGATLADGAVAEHNRSIQAACVHFAEAAAAAGLPGASALRFGGAGGPEGGPQLFKRRRAQ